GPDRRTLWPAGRPTHGGLAHRDGGGGPQGAHRTRDQRNTLPAGRPTPRTRDRSAQPEDTVGLRLVEDAGRPGHRLADGGDTPVGAGTRGRGAAGADEAEKRTAAPQAPRHRSPPSQRAE